MCPDNEKTPEDEQTEHRGTAGPTPETSQTDATIAYDKDGSKKGKDNTDRDRDETGTVADEDEGAPTIAVPASHPTQNTATGGAGAQSSTGGGSVPFTPVRDMTAGSLEKEKAKPMSKASRSVGHRFANRFEVVDVLGEGGMGKVFRVRDTHIDNREMALKVLRPKYSNNPQFRALFTKEIHAAQNFVSENVVQIRDTGQTADNQLFLTMDMVDGEDLHELLKREGALLPRHALEIVRQTLIGLHSGHEQGFIHRDIKPSNLMLSAHVPKTDDNPYGVGVQVLDFGIAGIAAEVSGQIAGTPMYMSPEQAQGQRLDPRSDLFAIGVVMFEMLTGTRPFEGKTLEQVVTSILETKLTEMIADLKHLGRPVQKILTKALQKDREKRFQSANEFIQAIENSKAFRNPTNLPPGTATVMGIAMLAAIGQGAYIGLALKDTATLQSELRDAKLATTNLRGELNQKHGTAITDMTNAHTEAETTWKNERTVIEQARDSFETQRDLEAGKYSQAYTEKLTLESAAESHALKIKELKGDHRTEMTDLKAKLGQETIDKEEAERLLHSLRLMASVEGLTAVSFDRILQFLEEGSPIPARTTLRDLAANQGIFKPDGTDGGTMMNLVVAVAEGLAQFDAEGKAGGGRPKTLTQARSQLANATSGLNQFNVAADLWIRFAQDGEEAPARVEQLKALLSDLGGRIATKQQGLDSISHSSAKEIEDGPATQDPTQAFAVASFADDEFLDRLLKRCVADLTSTYESSRGELNLHRLGELQCLSPWVKHFDSVGSQHVYKKEYVTALREFHTAKVWYLGTETEQAAMDNVSAVPQLGAGSPKIDWRARQQLQMAVHKNQAFRHPAGRRAVYLQTDTETDERFWTIVTHNVDKSGPDLRIAESQIYIIDNYGNPKAVATREIRTTQEDRKFLRDGDLIQDLSGTGEHIKVANWKELAERDLPEGDFPTPSERTRFLEAFDKGTHPCLVEVNGDRTAWYSPTYGLVRFLRGTTAIDLVHLDF